MGGKFGKNWCRDSQIFEVRQAHPHTILVKEPPPPETDIVKLEVEALKRHQIGILKLYFLQSLASYGYSLAHAGMSFTNP